MEYVAQAWNSVKVETIINCWRKTGILPTVDSNDGNIQEASAAQEIASQEDQEAIEFLLQQLSPIETIAEINQYLETIDLTIPTEQSLTDIEIVRLILDEEREGVELDGDESEEHSAISMQEGFNG